MRPVIPPDDLAPYRLHSRVTHSCLLPGLLRTAYIHELYIHVSWRGYSVPPTFRIRTAFSVAHIVRAGSTDIWSLPHLVLHSLVSLLDMNSSVYFSTHSRFYLPQRGSQRTSIWYQRLCFDSKKCGLWNHSINLEFSLVSDLCFSFSIFRRMQYEGFTKTWMDDNLAA